MPTNQANTYKDFILGSI